MKTYAMPIPAMWVDRNQFEVDEVAAVCPACGPQVLGQATASYSYVVWLFAFGFVKRLEVAGTCPGCDQTVRVFQADVPRAVRRQVPFLHRFGCATIALIGFLFAVIMAALNN